MEDNSPLINSTSTARFSQCQKAPSHSASPEALRTALSHREQQILKMVGEDLTYQQIADRLGLSYRTIEFHNRRIKNRLGVNGVAGMVRYAIRTGLMEP